MAYAFNEDKSKVEVLPASNTYAKNEVYTKSETSTVLASYVTRATADAIYVPRTSPNLVPAGAITQFAGVSAPAGWLLCNGQAISRTTYADLFAVIGTTYGTGDGSTTFNLPDLRDKFPIGKNAGALGSTGGSSTKTLTTANLPAHTHGNKSITGDVGQVICTDLHYTSSRLSFTAMDNVPYANSVNEDARRRVIHMDASHEHDSVGEGQAFDSMPPYITLNYIIKY